MAKLELFLLGRPQVYVDGQAVNGFNTRKDCALLAYLATTGTIHSRETLAGLLWSELPEDKARRNLRHTLSHLQKVIGPDWLTTERGVALTQDHPWSVDVQTLRSALTPLNRRIELDVAIIEQVLSLYRGEFLQGFHVQEAVHFEEWVLAQREELRLLTLRGLETLGERCLAQGAYALGLVATRHLLQLEPWLESVHRLQMQMLAQSGRRAEALTQYERCRQLLAAELGVEPMPETTALYQQIQAGRYHAPIVQQQAALLSAPVQPAQAPTAQSSEGLTVAPPWAQAPARQQPPNNLLTPLAGFVGRQAELAFISRRLAAADCRLLTIVGPGGMGKTSLAQAAAQQILQANPADFPDGIYFVSLLDIGAADERQPAQTRADELAIGEAILRVIAEQIGYKLEPGVAPAVQLQAYLRSRRLLLILDNFEHLVAGTDAVIALLTQAPQIKALITSRARLNVRGESVLPLHPLSLPLDKAPAAVEATQAATWQASDAIAMFVQRAQQVDPAFAINAETIGPVGIELATSMLSLLSCGALAAALTNSLDVLAADTRDIPSEQRTLAAVFERSWRLLPSDGQQLLARLSIFPGSFGRDAAEAIAGATHALLRRLLDQSLLSKVGDDRYAMHRTVHAFAQQKLQQWPDLSETLQVHYAHFYLEFLARLEAGLTTAAYATSVVQIQADLDNVRTAWRWAVTHDMYGAINRGLLAIYLFYEQQGFYTDSIALYDHALAHFGPGYEKQQTQSEVSPELKVVMGRLHTHFGWCNLRLGRFLPALAAYESGWALLQQADSPGAAAVCLAFWGSSTRGINPQRSVELLTEALRWAHVSGIEWGQAIIGQALGETIFLLGNYAEAEVHISAGYTLAKQIDWPRSLTSGAKALGRLNLVYGRYHQAEKYLRESIGIARQHQLKILCLESVIMLGEALRLQGRRAEANTCFEESRQLAAALGSGEFIAPILWEEGCLAEQDGEYQIAKARFTESLAIGLPNWWTHALPTLGWALIRLGELTEAQTYFQKVLTKAETQARMAISLDAQVGLAYLEGMHIRPDRPDQQASLAQCSSVLQTVYHHPAATAETRQRIDQIRPAFERAL